MKCLGALSSFIRRIFFLESAFIGLVGGIIGVILGSLITVLGYGASYGMALVLGGSDWGRLSVAAAHRHRRQRGAGGRRRDLPRHRGVAHAALGGPALQRLRRTWTKASSPS